MLGLFEERCERQSEIRQEGAGEALLGFRRQLLSNAISSFYETINFDEIQLRIHDPVFKYPKMFVALQFDGLVQFAVALGQNFDH